MNQEPGDDWTLREHSVEAITEISKYLRAHLVKISRGNVRAFPSMERARFSTDLLAPQFNVTALSDTFGQWVAGRNDHSESFLKDLVKAAGGKDNDAALDKLTASLILEVVATAPLFSKAMTHVVNFFLQDGREQLRAQVTTLAGGKTEKADAEVMKFVYEALSEYFLT